MGMGETGLLWHALGICPGDVVAFTGGGGKTSLALRVVRELTEVGRPPVFTCTTRIFPVPWMLQLYVDDLGEGWLDAVAAVLAAGRPVCLGARLDAATGKVVGIAPEQVAALKQLRGTVILVEADGSGGRPLKTPAPHEPVIPSVADIVVPVAGASVLGQPLGPALVHRVECVAAVTGAVPGSTVTPAVVAEALVSAEGCTRCAPAGARVVPVLGQADLPGAEAALRETAGLLLERVGRVVLAAPRAEEPVRAVIGRVAVLVLAGGASRRFGGNKLLHGWGGGTVLEASLQASLRSGLKEVVVVTGAYHDRLAPLLARYPVRVVPNPDWGEGMSTSLRAGLQSLGDEPEAVAICLGDMPFLPPVVVVELARTHAQTHAPIVAPVAGGQRRNPVLFDRSLFPQLMQARGDEGGRSVLRAHQDELLLVPFPDEDWFRDVDTPTDL
jgi:molybdenum cofactor cytidylyltransferase